MDRFVFVLFGSYTRKMEESQCNVTSVGRESNLPTEPKKKKCRRSITLEIKLEILKLFDSGLKMFELSKMFSLSYSTVNTIVKDREKYMYEVRNARPLTTTLIRNREGLIPEMEKLLIPWINEETKRLNMPPGKTVIKEKAKCIFDELKEKRGEVAKNAVFSASKGWFERFTKRMGLQNIRTQATAVHDADSLQNFLEQLGEIIREGYAPQQVFNVVETGLYWKKMPARTYLAKEEKSIVGCSASKQCLSLLLGANAAGDCRLKPLLVYHAQNPKALKDMSKQFLPVIWKYNPSARLTKEIFEDWFHHYFAFEVRDHCEKCNLPFKALLILDNEPFFPREFQKSDDNIRVIFLPTFANSLLQPMDQGIISSFKTYYLKQTFDSMVEAVASDDGPSMREHWQSYDILDAVKVMEEAWLSISTDNLKSAWRNLCPQFLSAHENFLNPTVGVKYSLIEMAKRIAVNMPSEDANEFLDIKATASQNEMAISWIPNNENSCSQASVVSNNANTQECSLDIVSNPLSDLDTATSELKSEDTSQITNSATVPLKRKSRLTMKRLSKAFKSIDAALNIFQTNDPDTQRSSEIAASVREAYSCYRNNFKEMKGKEA